MQTSKQRPANDPDSSNRKQGALVDFLDAAGAVGALGCTVHCALMPVALAMIPAFTLALSSFHDPHHGIAIGMLLLLRWEPYLLAGSVAFAGATSLLRRHGESATPAGVRLLCAGMLFALALNARAWTSPWWHAGLMLLGGMLLSSVHVAHLRAKSPGSIFRIAPRARCGADTAVHGCERALIQSTTCMNLSPSQLKLKTCACSCSSQR